ncbi:MAG: hypothetical protein JXA87_13360 [Thermoleophilia bacterium]|nr:hypothetical protein [Thermoleophilia bacterium]
MSYDLSVPASLIAERMGLNYPEDRWPDLAKGLEKTAESLGFDSSHAFVARLLSDSFGQREVQALATHLTIGETHFFRSPDTFTMLQSWLLPELIAAQQHTTRRLRIWSAGCATGQEPYSLAILVSRLIPDRADWDVTILGTDVNPEVFATANKAEYTQWSFRGTPSWVVNGYFTRTPEGRYLLDSAIRDMVTFRYLNLVDDVYPSLGTGIHDFDLILCRNVLMYFSRETAARVAERLHRSLKEGGYFLVTPSEASRDIQGGLTSLMSSGEIIYKKTPRISGADHGDTHVPVTERRRTEQPTSKTHARPAAAVASHPHRAAHKNKDQRHPGAPAKPAHAPKKVDPAEPPRVERRGKNRPFAAYAEKLAAEAARRPPKALDPAEVAREARLLADRGDLKQALARCESVLECDKLNPSLYYLKASILQELDRPDEAEQALQSTLFLDGSFALARIMLGAIARNQSRSGEAAKHFREALVLLAQMPSNTVLPETDGLTAGEMAETVASLMGSECVS